MADEMEVLAESVLAAEPPAEAETPETEVVAQVEGETPEAEGDDTTKSARAKRRERDAQYKQHLRDEADKWRIKADEAEARRVRLVDAHKSVDKPKEGDFTDYEEYRIALASWTTIRSLDDREAKLAGSEAKDARDQAARVAAEEAKVTAQEWADRVSEAQTRYADFDKVALDKSVPISAAMAKVITTSDVGPDLAYHLGQNKSLAAKIAAMPDLEAARAIGRLEASLSAPKARTETKAPAPITPVKGSGGANRDPSKMSVKEFAAWWDAGGRP